MDSALKSAAIVRNSVIIAAVISLVAQVAKLDVAPEAIQALADQISDIITLAGLAWAGIASAWSRYRAKKVAQAAGEPPSIIGNSGLSTLDTMTALSIMVILAFVLAGYGCQGFKMNAKPGVAERIAVSLSAKALGQKLQGDFKWHPQIDAFVAMIEKDGVTLNSGQMAHNYLMPRIPELYQREARIVFESVGFEFSGDELVSVAKVNKALLLEAVGAFKEGLAYKGRASIDQIFLMPTTTVPGTYSHQGYVLQGLTEQEIDQMIWDAAKRADEIHGM